MTTLANQRIVILRPRPQAIALSEYVKAQGGEPEILPVLMIEPLMLDQKQLAEAERLLRQGEILFVASQNAVYSLPDVLLQAILDTKGLKIITMGKGTSAALMEKGMAVFWTAPSGSTSESLLEVPFLQAQEIRGKRVVLLVGEGGRQLIAQTLIARGARVNEITVYQQIRLALSLEPLLTQWQQSKRCCFLATSLNTLAHLCALTPPHLLPWLYMSALIVVSERIRTYAMTQGFSQVTLSQGADFDSLVEALQQIAKKCV